MRTVEHQLTLLVDARRRDMARAFVALFVALSMMFAIAAGFAGPVNVAFAVDEEQGGLDPEDAGPGGELGAPTGGPGEDSEEGSDDGGDSSQPPEEEAGGEQEIILMSGGGGGGDGYGTVRIEKVAKAANGHQYPLGGVTFKIEKDVDGNWTDYGSVTDNGEGDDDPDIGEITVTLPVGKYRFSEEDAPPGYTKSTDKPEVNVKANESHGPHKFVNVVEVVRPAIIITKYEDTNGNGKINPNQDRLQGGFTFKVTHLIKVGNGELETKKSFFVKDNGSKDADPTPGVILLNSVDLEEGQGIKNYYQVSEVPRKGWTVVESRPKDPREVKKDSAPEFEFLNQRVPVPDLKVRKKLTVPGSGNATVGDEIVFEITATNTGEVDLQDVSVTDFFDWRFLKFLGVDGVEDEQRFGNQVTWKIANLGVGDSKTYTVRFEAKAATGPFGTVNNVWVKVKHEGPDLVRKDWAKVKIKGQKPEPEPTVDLVIYKYGPNENVGPLAGAAFLITGDGVELAVEDNQENVDMDPADGVIRVKGLAPGQYEVQETRAPEGYRLTEEPKTVELECGQGEEQQAALLHAGDDDEPCGEVEVKFFNEPEDDEPSSPPVTTTRNPRVDLAVTKVVDNPTPEEGQIVTFTVTVTNQGPDDARNVVYSDLMPAGLTYQSHSASQGTYDPVSGRWEVGDLDDDESATLTVTAIVDQGTAGQLLTNRVTLVSSSPNDADSSNNSASASVAPPQVVLVEEEPPTAEPPAAEAPPLPVTGGSAAAVVIPGLLALAAGVYVRRRFL